MEGRDVEWAALRALVDSPGDTGKVLVLSGIAGSGKTALLDATAAHAATAGTRVLRLAGAAGEARWAFAGLHQLVGPLRTEVAALPVRQRDMLRGAVGLADAPQTPDLMLLGLGVLTLLTELAARRPLLLVVDDAQWIDSASLDALGFAARRLGRVPVTLLLGTRTLPLGAGLDRDHPVLELGPLDGVAAGLLLDTQPYPPTGRDRVRLLAQAAGNPLALVELARMYAAGAPSDGPLPVAERIARLFTARIGALPPQTRRALLLAAADPALAAVAVDPVDWTAAIEADLVQVAAERVLFRHPVAASAVYQAATAEDRRAAHRDLAAASHALPDRHAWHLAAATLLPDEQIAAGLQATADRAGKRGGYVAAAKALHRAADLSPAPESRALRLVLAAGAALLAGQSAWALELLADVPALTRDPAMRAEVELRTGQALTLEHRYPAAFATLTDAVPSAGLETASELLATAALVAYYSGDPAQRAETVRLLHAAQPPHTAAWAWTLALTDPYRHRGELMAALPALIEDGRTRPATLTTLATVAWVLDETQTALRLFDEAAQRWRVQGPVPEGLGCAMGVAAFEHGRLDLAYTLGIAAADSSAGAGLPVVAAGADAIVASVLAVRGDLAAARDLGERALRQLDVRANLAIVVRARYALGLAAEASGDHEAAYQRFRSLFDSDGAPVHHHVSYTALADLAAAAARTGRRADAAEVLDRAEHDLTGNRSDRLALLLHRGWALLASSETADAEAYREAERHHAAALALPATGRWPFERARLLLERGEWLRRRRRISEARPVLREALETFAGLGARPWVQRCEAELRAAGVAVSRAADALQALTPQQRQIVRLAAAGLTNREIAERMFLSAKTVSSHLYRSFPKLGVSTRNQLRDVVPSSDR